MNTILQITKQECKELQEKYGYRFGNEGMLHKSHSERPKYYVTESRKALSDLRKIRESHIRK